MSSDESVWRVCSTCKTPIPYESDYFACSVSTCNRKRTALYFCSVPCFDAHVPEARHRDAWAEKNRAPSRAEWERQQTEERAKAERDANPEPAPQRRVVSGTPENEDLPREVLIVVSKLKAYIKARSGMNTSDNVVGVLSDHLRRLCNQAIRLAAEDDRRTVMDRDFQPLVERAQRD